MLPTLRPVVGAGLALLLATGASAQVPTRNFDLLAHRNDYPPTPGYTGYSACWGYVAPDGREFAIVGTFQGTAIYEVTDPANTAFVEFIPGPPSEWREMKAYRQWVYVVTEGLSAGRGLQIIRMSDPLHPTLVATYTTGFVSSHTVSVDTTRALLICNGTKYDAGGGSYPPAGMHVLSLADPEAPVELARWPSSPLPVPVDQYVHDCEPIGTRLYASSIYSAVERVFDLTDPANPVEIASWTCPGAYTHSAWPDASGRWLYVADEVNGEPLRVFDLSDLSNPAIVNAFTCNPHAIVHNPRVAGGVLYLANYTEGVRALDLSDPVHPAEFAWADSWPGPSGGYSGVWEVYPFFPSGTVIASDMQSGLYVYRPRFDYGILRVRVTDAASGQPFADARVYLATQGDSLVTPADGVVRFAPSPGTHTVVARAFGYDDASDTRTVTVGSRDTLSLAMVARPMVPFAGTVTDEDTGAPLAEADVTLRYTPFAARTDASGHFDLGLVPDDVYRVEVRAAGHVPLAYDRRIGPGSGGQDFALAPAATWDAIEIPIGWTVGAPGDGATGGVWVWVEPLGTSMPQAAAAAPRGAEPLAAQHEGHEEDGATPGQVQPETDHTPDPGRRCFVTGQGTDPTNIGEADVDGGTTTLTSPVLDLSGMVRPTIAWWQWFYASGDDNDWLAVLVSANGGQTWVPVDTTRGLANRWTERSFRVDQRVAPSAQVRVRFVAADLGASSIVEAAIDDLETYDAAPDSTGPGGLPQALRFGVPRPNPSTDGVRLALELPRAGRVRVEVLDLAGRRIATLRDGPAVAGTLEVAWDGRDSSGARVAPGLYLARAATPAGRVAARIVRLR